MASQNLIDIFGKIFASYALLLIIAAIFLNPLVLFICLRSKKLRSTSTFKMLSICSINDLLSCLVWNQENFTGTFFDFKPMARSLFYCRFFSVFLQYVTLEYACWLLVSISLDRYLSLRLKKWSKQYFRGARPVIYSFVLLLIIIGINFNEILYDGYSYTENGTEIIVCYATAEYDYSWFDIESQVIYIIKKMYSKTFFGSVKPLYLIKF